MTVDEMLSMQSNTFEKCKRLFLTNIAEMNAINSFPADLTGDQACMYLFVPLILFSIILVLSR